MLMVIKTAWMWISPYPELSPALSAWERNAARFVHAFFRIVLVVIPVIGFLCVASDGEPVNLYDIIEIPAVGQFDEDLRDVLFDLHAYLAYGVAALIAVHILGALKHHFLDRSGSLRRISF
jgi:cytochrome b561